MRYASPEAALVLPLPPAWVAGALCAQIDPDLFYPDQSAAGRVAKAICGRCDVRPECLAYAVEHREQHGIWGGLTERERQKLHAPRPRRRGGMPAGPPRDTHCVNGHEWTEANTYYNPAGRRQCRGCNNDRRRPAERAA